jgi:hypothetical protein
MLCLFLCFSLQKTGFRSFVTTCLKPKLKREWSHTAHNLNKKRVFKKNCNESILEPNTSETLIIYHLYTEGYKNKKKPLKSTFP